MMKYQIGQEVWFAGFDSVRTYVECPDCGGSARVRVMLPDDTIVSIACEGCREGYNGSWGRIRVYTRKPTCELVTLTGVEIEGEKAEWRALNHYRMSEDDLFDNEADCMVAAQAKADRYDQEERDRINHKEKPLKSWAWHAHYHRKQIKDAEKNIEYHKARLAVASLKAKADKVAA
jgi:hypothetical protein